ncbi:hypothetical protein FIBSPDRAFT_866214 [Athelia psychrophila]|uniref:Uncharacterized protein n=1 Tax=Athelia psychrophila TaxID=1759441 RepID=A0A166EWT2_9AGAM|nr:hypothetical protein FIBSPDRAFT_866214 [Fibularhizoctonia sp. CBS 109695]
MDRWMSSHQLLNNVFSSAVNGALLSYWLLFAARVQFLAPLEEFALRSALKAFNCSVAGIDFGP